MTLYRRLGFTIVELLIVIVVIGILASITLVSFTGISNRANIATLQSDLVNASNQLEMYNQGTSSDNTYPTSLSLANIKSSPGVALNYFTPTSRKSFCLSATTSNLVYSISNYNNTPKDSDCYLNGIVGWYKLNGNANDSSDYANNGTVSSATLTTGQNGLSNTAYSFGAVGYISVTNPIIQKLSTQVTTTAWVYFTTGSSGIYQFILSRYIGSYEMNKGGANQLRFEVSCSDSTTHRADGSGTFLSSLNTWYFVSTTFDASNGDMTMYINGTPLTVGYVDPHTACGTLKNTDLNTYLGSRGPWPSFNGSIDDARIYNRVLTQAEINSIYTAGAQ